MSSTTTPLSYLWPPPTRIQRLRKDRLSNTLKVNDTVRMASATLIPVSEYLNTTYRRDCDYIEGEVRERNVGERLHELLQSILFAIFHGNRRAWNIVVLPEQRVQTSSSNFCVPNVYTLRRSGPVDAVV